jgi:photosystem II stability/assembly factor-like uncharacterized protein
MHGRSSWLILLCAVVAVRASAYGGEAPTTASPKHIPPSWRGDATLHAVTKAGPRRYWAVGDHGVILASEDGGETWQPQDSGTTASLRGVQALTDRVLFAVGGWTEPHTGRSRGVVLSTRDGGFTWTNLLVDARDEVTESKPAAASITHPPALTGLKFFSAEEGLAWGEADGVLGGGLYRTEDGGRTWTGVGGAVPGDVWSAGDFVNPTDGALVSGTGAVARVAGNALSAGRPARIERRRVHGVRLGPNGEGWLVGDGGLLMRTTNGGVAWEPLPALPSSARGLVDLAAIEMRGSTVWVAGRPGTRVWRSSDHGNTWTTGRTTERGEIRGLAFGDDRTGVAVGAWGTILKTVDAGETWSPVLGGDRRAAALVCVARDGEVPHPLLADVAGERGYRTRVVSLTETKSPGLERSALPSLRALEQAVHAGGTGVDRPLRLPLSIPDAERDQTALLKDWDRRMESTWRTELLATLVREIRLWRPSVLIRGPVAPNDAVAKILAEAIDLSVVEAADGTRHTRLEDELGLKAWRVARVYEQGAGHTASGSGDATVDPFRYLPHLGMDARAWLESGPLATPGVALASSRDVDLARPIEYRRLQSAEQVPGQTEPKVGSDFFTGLNLASGGDARRTLDPIRQDDLEAGQRRATQSKHVAAIVDRTLDTPQRGGQGAILAQLGDLTRDLDQERAAAELARVATRMRAQGEFDSAELVELELASRYPKTGVGRRTRAELVVRLASLEHAWRRLRVSKVEVTNVRPERQGAAVLIDEAGGVTTSDLEIDPDKDGTGPQPAGYTTAKRTERREMGARLELATGRALDFAKGLEQDAPELHARADVQFALASALRRQGRTASAAEIFLKLAARTAEPDTSRAARMELWLAQPVNEPALPLAVADHTATRPHLDGLLSDPCWAGAAEVLLQGETTVDDPSQASLAMFSHDDRYLYVAISCGRSDSANSDTPPDVSVRDSDLAGCDRVRLRLDVDRDGGLWYEWTIDEHGRATDLCGGNPHWNPRYYLATQRDETRWRLEMAVPLEELVEASLARGDGWRMDVERIRPGVDVERWPSPGTSSGAPLGVLTFDR